MPVAGPKKEWSHHLKNAESGTLKKSHEMCNPRLHFPYTGILLLIFNGPVGCLKSKEFASPSKILHMRKIILALILLASFYALSVWASNPLNPTNAPAIQDATLATGEASFTGGLLIFLSIGIGYFLKRLYRFRSLNQE